MPRDGAARSGRVGGWALRRRRPRRRALCAVVRIRRGRAAQSLARPHRRRSVDQTGPLPRFRQFRLARLRRPGVAGADGPRPSRRARPHEDAGRPRSPCVGDLQVALRSLSARAGRPGADAGEMGQLRRTRTLAAPAPTIEPRRSLRSLPSPISIRRVSRRANFSARWLRRMAPMCATRCGSTRPSSTRSSVTAGSSRDLAPTLAAPAHFDVGSIAVKAAWRILDRRPTRPPSAAATTSSRARKWSTSPRVSPRASPSAPNTTSPWSDCTSRSKRSTGRSGCGARSSTSTMCRRSAAAVRASRMRKTRMRPIRSTIPPRSKPTSRRRWTRPWRNRSDRPTRRRSDPEPTQVVRRHPINPETMAMNRAYWSLPEVRGTVWAHYMLVATQWPTVTQPPTPDNDGRYFPGPRIDPNTPGEPYQVDETKMTNRTRISPTSRWRPMRRMRPRAACPAITPSPMRSAATSSRFCPAPIDDVSRDAPLSSRC